MAKRRRRRRREGRGRSRRAPGPPGPEEAGGPCPGLRGSTALPAPSPWRTADAQSWEGTRFCLSKPPSLRKLVTAAAGNHTLASRTWAGSKPPGVRVDGAAGGTVTWTELRAGAPVGGRRVPCRPRCGCYFYWRLSSPHGLCEADAALSSTTRMRKPRLGKGTSPQVAQLVKGGSGI